MQKTFWILALLCVFTLSGTLLTAAQPPAPPSASGRDVLAYVSDLDGDYEVFVMEMGRGSPRQLTDNDITDWYPDWSPDGERLAFGSGRGGEDYEITVLDADCDQLPGGCEAQIQQLTDNDSNDIDPVWSPDGRQLAFVSDIDGDEDIHLMDLDSGEVAPITVNDTADKDPAWAADGLAIFYSASVGEATEITFADFNGESRALTDNDGSDEAPSAARNGRYIAFHSDMGGNYDIYLLDLYTEAVKQLTNDPGDDFTPTWSPDGKRLAFVSDRDGDFEIFVMKPDGSGLQQLTNNSASDLGPAWKPAGSRTLSTPATAVPTVFVPTLPPTIDPNMGICRLFTPDGGEVNIRSGPGTTYAQLGRFRGTTEFPVTGYNGNWFTINYSGQQGWVAGWVTERRGDCQNLAFVPAPPLPATAVPTAPPPPAGAVIDFWADSYNIYDDQCTRIKWRVENIQSVTLDGAGVIGEDVREVCPDVNTVYTLRVTLQDGTTTDRTVAINVTPRVTAQPDLYVSEFSLNPNPPVKGQPVEVRIGVYNQGDAPVPATAFRVEWWPGEYYASPACTWDLGSMAAHGGRIVTCTYPGYPSSYGSINTVVKIDVLNTISESDEGNNVFSQGISVASP